MCGPARNVCVCYGLWNPPTASLPNCISAPRVASWRKTLRISFHSSSCASVPVGVLNLATCACVKSEEEGLVKKNRLQYFEFGLQYLVQPLGVNPTYSTFNVQKTHYFSNTVHYCRSSMPRLSQTLRFLQRPSFRQAQSALIGQLTQCIVIGRTPQAWVRNVTPLSIIASFSFQNKCKDS